MNLENFIVRPKRGAVERFAKEDTWAELAPGDQAALKHDVAGLPSSVASGSPEAKQFDLLMLRMELTLLRGEPGFDKLKENVCEISRLLEAQTSIPMVAAKITLIQQIQSEMFWQDVDLADLEIVRKALRDLVQFIERRKRSTVITDFVDEIADGLLIDLPGTTVGVDPENACERRLSPSYASTQMSPVMHKLKFNEALSSDDLGCFGRYLHRRGFDSRRNRSREEGQRRPGAVCSFAGWFGSAGCEGGAFPIPKRKDAHCESNRVH